jgi:hypothetical protein
VGRYASIVRGHLRGILARHRGWWPKEAAFTFAVRRGDAILMRPLLLPASSSAAEPASRPVIHVEFAADELPDGMQWHEHV